MHGVIVRALSTEKQEEITSPSIYSWKNRDPRGREGLSGNQQLCFYFSDFFFFNLSGLQQSPSIYGFFCSALSGLICKGQHLAQKESKTQLWPSAVAGTVRILIYT